MKKLAMLIAVFYACAACNVFADTTAAPGASPVPPKQQEQKKSDNDSSSSTSVYDSIKSGWNSFIDVLTGTTGKSK